MYKAQKEFFRRLQIEAKNYIINNLIYIAKKRMDDKKYEKDIYNSIVNFLFEMKNCGLEFENKSLRKNENN